MDDTPNGIDGIDGEQYTMDEYVVLAARIDTSFANLCNYLQAFLLRQSLAFPDEFRWRKLLAVSDMRIRKGLKLFAQVFYVRGVC